MARASSGRCEFLQGELVPTDRLPMQPCIGASGAAGRPAAPRIESVTRRCTFEGTAPCCPFHETQIETLHCILDTGGLVRDEPNEAGNAGAKDGTVMHAIVDLLNRLAEWYLGARRAD